MRVIITSLAWIEAPTIPLVKYITQILRIKNPARATAARFGSHWAAAKIPEYINGWLTAEGRDVIGVPRAWFFEHLAQHDLMRGVTISIKTAQPGQVEWPTPFMQMYQHQENGCAAVMAMIEARDKTTYPTDTMIVLPPSGGKTVLGMFLAYKSNEKCLAIVPSQEIEESWINDAHKVFGLTSAAIGRIRGKHISIGDHLTVGSVQTLMKLDPKLWANAFGILILDEVHRLPGDSFVKVLVRSTANLRVGLTATDYRKDGRMPVVRWHLGQNSFKDETPHNSVPLVYHGMLTEFNTTAHVKVVGDEPNYDFAKLVELMTTNEQRNWAILSLISRILSEKDGYILVTSCRVEHIELLSGMLSHYLESIPCAVITGATKNRKVLFEGIRAGKYPITLATQSIVQEGASVPVWHHVISTTPFSDPKTAIQLTGRAIRKPETGGHIKNFGHFWHFVDAKIPMCNRMAKTVFKTLKTRVHKTFWYDMIHDASSLTTLITRKPKT